MSRASRTRMMATRKSSRMNASEDNIAPWPEWSDAYANSVSWNPYEVPVRVATAVTDKTGKSTAKAASVRSKRASSIRKSDTKVPPVDEKFFTDGCSLSSDFHGIDVATWEKADRVEGLNPLLVKDYFDSSLDLISNNAHLMDIELMKDVIESVSCLLTASVSYPFTAEFQGTNFTPSRQFWKPWHHIYAINKTVAGDVPMPSYNKFGKYLVRLYFLGKWRKIEVDDQFPLDDEGRLLLPICCSKDLWFPILTKALLRVITACGDKNNVSVITALTGWIKTTASLDGADSEEVWNLCCSHLLKEDVIIPQIPKDIHCSYRGNSCLNGANHLTESERQKVFVFASITEPVYSFEDIEPEKRELFTFINRVSQNWIKPKNYPLWKEHRWFDWAYRHNILTGKIGQIFKMVEIYCPVWNALSECPEVQSAESLEPLNEPLEPPFEPVEPPNPFKECDLERFKKYVKQLALYYLPSQFEHNLRSEDLNHLHSASDEMPVSEQRPKTKATAKSQDQTKAKVQAITTSTSRYHEESCPSFHLLIDSPYCKRVYIDMMFFKTDSDSSCGHVTCEEFIWSDDIPRTPLFFTKTLGSVCKIITAGPGRHMFKISCGLLPTKYFVQIFSNTPFLLDTLENLQEILREDSVSYKIYGANITEQFKQLLSAQYGSERHSQALKSYMDAFYPTNLLQKTESHQNLVYRLRFDKLMEESIFEFIMNRDIVKSIENTSNFIGKLKKLFFNPSFGDNFLSELVKNESLNPANDIQTAAPPPVTTAKSTAKGKEKIKPPAVSVDIFFDNVENNIELLKRIMRKEVSFLRYYPFCFDEDTKIMFHDYKGKAELQSYHPFVIVARFILNIHSSTEIPCAIYPFINHDFCRICVYDVETMNLVQVNFGRNSVWRLTRSDMGFIILVLCFSQNSQNVAKGKSQELQWRIRVTGSSEDSLLHPCRSEQEIPCVFTPASPPQSIIETIRGYYVPNAFNLITKFKITLTQNDIVTLQLSVSCPTAILTMVVKDKNENVVREVEGKGNILMPTVLLSLSEAYDNHTPRYYLGEVLLKYSSWELTNNEKMFMNTAKEYYVPFSDISGGGSKNKRKKLKTAMDDDSFAPVWTLTMMTEQTTKDKSTKLLPDTSIYDEYNSSTAEASTEERLAKGAELRLTFWAYLENEMAQGESHKAVSLDIHDYYHNLLEKYSCGNRC